MKWGKERHIYCRSWMHSYMYIVYTSASKQASTEKGKVYPVYRGLTTCFCKKKPFFMCTLTTGMGLAGWLAGWLEVWMMASRGCH